MHWLILCVIIALSEAIRPTVRQDVIDDIFKNLPVAAVTKPNPTLKRSSHAPCRTRFGEDGVCVLHHFCDKGRVRVNGKLIISIRSAFHSECEDDFEICCIPPDVRNQTNVIAPSSGSVQRGCGWRNPDGVGVSTNSGNPLEAKFGEFPWMVVIIKFRPIDEDDPEGPRANVYIGGGSLIHPRAVLTAAHTVAGIQPLRVRAGDWNVKDTRQEPYPHQDVEVDSTVVHEKFDEDNLYYGIALLFLTSPVLIAPERPHVGLACLPPPSQTVPVGTKCLVSGWGKNNHVGGHNQAILKKIEVPVVSRRDCQRALRKTRLDIFFDLHSTFMCAGGEAGVDTCIGDGGSPLVCPIQSEPDRYMQSGIVAWGIGCGEDGTPGVYVDVSNLRTWIDDKMISQKLDINGYSL